MTDEELIDAFQHQLNIAKSYADDENPTRIPTVFQLQIGHLRDMWPEVRAQIEAQAAEIENMKAALKRVHRHLAKVLNDEQKAATRAEVAESKVKEMETEIVAAKLFGGGYFAGNVDEATRAHYRAKALATLQQLGQEYDNAARDELGVAQKMQLDDSAAYLHGIAASIRALARKSP